MLSRQHKQYFSDDMMVRYTKVSHKSIPEVTPTTQNQVYDGLLEVSGFREAKTSLFDKKKLTFKQNSQATCNFAESYVNISSICRCRSKRFGVGTYAESKT